jgi:hypothetical protein
MLLVALYLSYSLVHGLLKTPDAPARQIELAERFMRLSLLLAAVMVVVQIGERIVTFVSDSRVEKMRADLAEAQRKLAAPPPLNRRVIEGVTRWDWHWGEGGWETSGTFRSDAGKYDFAATTEHVGPKGRRRIIEWRSTKPFEIGDETTEIEFAAERKVVASREVCDELNLGPPTRYPTRIKFKKSWSLAGVYTGLDGGGPAGDIIFYAAGKD